MSSLCSFILCLPTSQLSGALGEPKADSPAVLFADRHLSTTAQCTVHSSQCTVHTDMKLHSDISADRSKLLRKIVFCIYMEGLMRKNTLGHQTRFLISSLGGNKTQGAHWRTWEGVVRKNSLFLSLIIYIMYNICIDK